MEQSPHPFNLDSKYYLHFSGEIVTSPQHVGACTDACVHTHPSTSSLSPQIRFEWWMVLRRVQGLIGKLSSLTRLLQFLALCSEKFAVGVCCWCFPLHEDKTTGGLSKGVSGLTLTTSGETRSKIYRYITAPSAPGRVWFHPAQSLHSLYGCVLPERLNNGRHQSTSEGPLPSSCTVKLILIEIDYSIWETWVINF